MKKIILLVVGLLTFLGAADFLMPQEAFKTSAVLDKNVVEIHIKLGKDIHLYKDSLEIAVDSKNIAIENIVYPESMLLKDREVYENDVALLVNLQKNSDISSKEEIKVHLGFQGCSSEGLCYEPIEDEFDFSIESVLLAQGAVLQNKPIVQSKPSVKSSETDTITNSFKNDSIWVVLLTFFGFGLLLSMTPCIFPMIPILSSIIVSQGENMTAKKGFFLSLVYVLSMAFAYTIAGVLAGVFGSNLQAAMQDPFVVIAFALVFVALAFSMFGFFEIGLPSSIQSRLSKVSDSASANGGVLGIAIMGFLSALIVGPCVAPPLAGTLVYIGQTGDAVLGGVALFVMSLGMGVPLLLIGLGAGKFMPRPGGWMNSVSKVFGVIMLAIAIWMLEKILPSNIIMVLWAMLFIISAIYLGALEPLEQKRGWHSLVKGVGIISLVYGGSLFVGILSGSTDMTQPLKNFTQQSSVLSNNTLNFQIVQSIDELDAIVKDSKGKKIMLDFAAKWCTSCRELDEITFKDSEVISRLNDYILIRADLTDNTIEEKALAKKYGIFGPPAILFFDENGNLIEDKKIIGYKSPKEFLDSIQ